MSTSSFPSTPGKALQILWGDNSSLACLWLYDAKFKFSVTPMHKIKISLDRSKVDRGSNSYFFLYLPRVPMQL